tara:strand:- start:242 stop:1510 length:1269 start_codon:yes stop_codon:yes gene_type:complete
MTVSTTTIKNSFSGNGSVVAFSYTFKIFSASEALVYVRTNATGAESLRTQGSGSTNYGISGVGAANGGTVTFVTAPTSAETVLIKRATGLQQNTDYQPADPFPAESHEEALDKLTHITQELQEELDRSFKVSRTNSITTPEFVDGASTRASLLLGFSSDGNNLEATTGRVSSVTTSNVAVDSSGASQSATASFNSVSGALALGIPVGATGPTGDPGTTASATQSGIVELATNAETVTGSDSARATTPASITARLAAPGAIGGTTAAASNFTTIGTTGNITLGDSASLNISTPLLAGADHTFSGVSAQMLAGGAIAAFDLVCIHTTTSEVVEADASAYATARVIGIAPAAISDTATGTVLLHGFVRDDTFNFTAGSTLYLSETAGAMTHTPPSTDGAFVNVVGVALSPDVVYINPSMDVLERA